MTYNYHIKKRRMWNFILFLLNKIFPFVDFKTIFSFKQITSVVQMFIDYDKQEVKVLCRHCLYRFFRFTLSGRVLRLFGIFCITFTFFFPQILNLYQDVHGIQERFKIFYTPEFIAALGLLGFLGFAVNLFFYMYVVFLRIIHFKELVYTSPELKTVSGLQTLQKTKKNKHDDYKI